MEPAKVVWQVDENERGRWRDFPRDLNALVEQARQGGQSGVVYVWPPLGGRVVTEYAIDFNAMMQTNKATSFQRKVRRVIVVDDGEAKHVEVIG